MSRTAKPGSRSRSSPSTPTRSSTSTTTSSTRRSTTRPASPATSAPRGRARLRRSPRRGAPGSSSSCWTRRSSTSGSAPLWTRCSACSTSAWSWARSRSGREEAMGDELLCSVADGVATVTLNRPAKRNALNRAVLEGLAGAFERLEGDPTVRVVVVRGAGPAFCSGMDLDDLARQQDASADPETSVVSVLRRIEQCRHPTLAVVHGDAFAGGCELALHCDLRVAAEPASFAMPLARLGLVVPFTVGQKLIEIIGPAMTRQILMVGRPLTARRAYEIGMVHEVVAVAELARAVEGLARTIAANAPLSLRGMKRTILRALAARDGIDHADLDALAAQARRSRDAREGVRAMLEKRVPDFRGE